MIVTGHQNNMKRLDVMPKKNQLKNIVSDSTLMAEQFVQTLLFMQNKGMNPFSALRK